MLLTDAICQCRRDIIAETNRHTSASLSVSVGVSLIRLLPFPPPPPALAFAFRRLRAPLDFAADDLTGVATVV